MGIRPKWPGVSRTSRLISDGQSQQRFKVWNFFFLLKIIFFPTKALLCTAGFDYYHYSFKEWLSFPLGDCRQPVHKDKDSISFHGLTRWESDSVPWACAKWEKSKLHEAVAPGRRNILSHLQGSIGLKARPFLLDNGAEDSRAKSRHWRSLNT